MEIANKGAQRRRFFSIVFLMMALTWGISAGTAQAASTSAGAAFLGYDTTSEGNWQAAYGGDGYTFADSAWGIPSYASFGVLKDSAEIWASSTTDVRVLQRDATRMASAWYGYGTATFSIDMSFRDGSLHRVALYGLDWFKSNRAELLQVVDANSGRILDLRTLTNFANGVYAIWNFKGRVRVNVVDTSGASAVMSAVFFGAEAGSGGAAPTITSQPAGQTVNLGQTATFRVTASGPTPVTYQWMKNGAPISGVTSSTYSTTAVRRSDSGSEFSVTVADSAGTVTSNAAMLTVGSGTLILQPTTSNLNFGSVNVSSGTSSLSVTLKNAGTGTVTIAGLRVSGPGFNAGGISSGTTLAAGQSVSLTATFDPASSGTVTGSVTVSSNATSTAHSVSLQWAPSASQVIGYNVYVGKTLGSSYSKLTASPVNTLTHTDNGLQAAQTRYYVVTSVASGNVESAYSTPAIAVVP
jgi:hypothetical protein